MAGDWVKMRVNLVAHPKVLRLADCLLNDGRFIEWSALAFGINGFPPLTADEARAERYAALRVTRYVTVTSLLRFWGYANEHAKGDRIDCVTPQDVDDITGVPGFAAALASIGWAVFDENGGVTMPDFLEHNTSAQERKTGGAQRQAKYRERLKTTDEQPSHSDVTRDVTRDVTVTEREEKRREERNTPLPPKGEGRFPDFWDSWPKSPRKQDRKKCAAKWQRNRFDEHANAILAHVIAMKETRQWLDGYEPAPLTYLNGERWKDGAVMDRGREDIFAGAR